MLSTYGVCVLKVIACDAAANNLVHPQLTVQLFLCSLTGVPILKYFLKYIC
jgi:hypothetical protein